VKLAGRDEKEDPINNWESIVNSIRNASIELSDLTHDITDVDIDMAERNSEVPDEKSGTNGDGDPQEHRASGKWSTTAKATLAFKKLLRRRKEKIEAFKKRHNALKISVVNADDPFNESSLLLSKKHGSIQLTITIEGECARVLALVSVSRCADMRDTGGRKDLIHFKLSKRELRKQLKAVGWGVDDIVETFSYYPDQLEICDLIPLREVKRILPPRQLGQATRNSGIMFLLKAEMRRGWRYLRMLLTGSERKGKAPLALKVLLSLPYKAHTITADMLKHLCMATHETLNRKIREQKGLSFSQIDLDRVQVRDIKAIAGGTHSDDPEAAPEAGSDEAYTYDVFLSYRVSSDKDLVTKVRFCHREIVFYSSLLTLIPPLTSSTTR